MNAELPRITVLTRKSPGAALSIKTCTHAMDVTHIVLLAPLSESTLHHTGKALWLHPLCHAKCYPPPPSAPVCMSYLMGVSYKDNPKQGLCGRFSASLQVWGREHARYQQWFSQSRVGDQTRTEHRKPFKGKAMCGVGKKRREEDGRETAVLSSQSHFHSVQS